MGLACFKIEEKKGFFNETKDNFLMQQVQDMITDDDLENVQNKEPVLDKKEDKDYHVKTCVFNFSCFPQNGYLIETGSKNFLSSHGFDFDEWKQNGIVFHGGDDVSFCIFCLVIEL